MYQYFLTALDNEYIIYYSINLDKRPRFMRVQGLKLWLRSDSDRI